jgi:zinc D-Ala-D-Ala carboxypeptidase
MNLSPHFTLEELTASQTAARLGLDNTPPPEIVDALTRTAMGLEGVRTVLGAPIIISSGYRSPDVNHAVGGQTNSQHQTGEAADFICPGFGTPHEIVTRLIKSGVNFDQCIVEFGRWVHVSFAKSPRRQALIIDHDGTRAFA